MMAETPVESQPPQQQVEQPQNPTAEQATSVETDIKEKVPEKNDLTESQPKQSENVASNGSQDDGPLYSAEQIKIPPNFPEILKQFTKAAIKENPKDKLLWAAEYFNKQAALGKNTASNKLTDTALKSLIEKLTTNGTSETMPKHDLIIAARGAGLDIFAINDILRVGLWDTASDIPWLSFWALAAAKSAGDLASTINLSAKLLGEGDQVPLQPVLRVFKYLAGRDQSFTPERIDAIINSTVEKFPEKPVVAQEDFKNVFSQSLSK